MVKFSVYSKLILVILTPYRHGKLLEHFILIALALLSNILLSWAFVTSLNCSVMCRLDCKTVGFFSKSVKKSVKHAVRILRVRSASLTRLKGCKTRLKGMWGEREKNDCPFSIQWVRSDQGVQKCRRAVKKSVYNSTLCEFDTLGNWFLGRIAHVIVCTWLRTLTLYPVILILALLLCKMLYIKWRIKNDWKWQYASKGCAHSSKGE